MTSNRSTRRPSSWPREAALDATADPRFAAAMERAYGWFLGGNRLHLQLADPTRGGCRDGLRLDGLNENQGAESTLSWLIALEHTRRARRDDPGQSGSRRSLAPTRGDALT